MKSTATKSQPNFFNQVPNSPAGIVNHENNLKLVKGYFVKAGPNEGKEIIDETENSTAQRDVGLIFAGQKAEHYEIATYGGLIHLAKTLGYQDAAREYLQ
jgi:ferritin-like metal-binding protein YciE